jgi:hypothetical protein
MWHMHDRKGLARGLALASLSALATLAMAQGPGQGQPAVALMVHQMKPNVYWIEGGGGTSGVIVGTRA